MMMIMMMFGDDDNVILPRDCHIFYDSFVEFFFFLFAFSSQNESTKNFHSNKHTCNELSLLRHTFSHVIHSLVSEVDSIEMKEFHRVEHPDPMLLPWVLDSIQTQMNVGDGAITYHLLSAWVQMEGGGGGSGDDGGDGGVSVCVCVCMCV